MNTLTRTTLFLGLLLSTPINSRASAAFKDVWYPNGKIVYHVADDAEGLRAPITNAMRYMSLHTPLHIHKANCYLDANLTFEGSWTAPNGGGYTYGYWDENTNGPSKKIRFDPDYSLDRDTVVHEFGHALGFPHEFQRSDRGNYVYVCDFDHIDVWNFAKLGTIAWSDPYYLLSPYDYGSVMNDGYSSCVSPIHSEFRDYGGIRNLLSVHDINGIYRMYGEKLGYNNDGDRFGVAVSSGDYDDDGYEDVVVANLQDGGLWLSFFRGVAKSDVDEIEDVAVIEHLTWVPWFNEEYDDAVSSDEDITLATGDFNGDGIDDLALGRPGYDDNRGRVSILFVNTLPGDPDKGDFEDDFAPWGRKGIQWEVKITAKEIGLATAADSSARPRFGAALAAVRATANAPDYTYHDLLVGAPSAKQTVGNSENIGAVVIIKGSIDNSPSDFSFADRETLWNPQTGSADKFGAAVTGVPGLCALADHTEQYYNDFIAVGAPDYDAERGAVYVYGCATIGTGGTLSTPQPLNSIYGAAAGARFGRALAGFRVFRDRYPFEWKSFLAVGQPRYEATDGQIVGRVILQEIDSSGMNSYVAALSPSDHSGGDEFGYTLAVQQRPYSYAITNYGGYQTYLGIGMPGAEVDGVRAGRVFVWRPLNEDGSVSYSTHKIAASNPNSRSDTRFGESIAALRTLKPEGGFVVGAPGAVTADDDTIAGIVSVLQNNWLTYRLDESDWDTVRLNLDQETEGDRRPTNQTADVQDTYVDLNSTCASPDGSALCADFAGGPYRTVLDGYYDWASLSDDLNLYISGGTYVEEKPCTTLVFSKNVVMRSYNGIAIIK